MTKQSIAAALLSILSFCAGLAIDSAMAQDPAPCPACEACPPPPACPTFAPAPTKEQIDAVQKAMEAIQAAENKDLSPVGQNP